MAHPLRRDEVFGLIHPAVDAHTLGISSVGQLLQDCGYTVVIADAHVCAAANQPSHLDNVEIVHRWIRRHGITRLGFSYRLDPVEGAERFDRLVYQLRSRRMLAEQGGPLRGIYFAGLPEACERVLQEHGDLVETFDGDETPAETLRKLGVPRSHIPSAMSAEADYDEFRLRFGQELVDSGKHLRIPPPDHGGYPEFGTAQDTVLARIRYAQQMGQLPLTRAHVGPYLPDREAAVRLFLHWTRDLARAGFLDVLSIGTSQLSQSHFGEHWTGLPNGGGVPINSPEEFRMVWREARPMLVRTYAGTKNIPQLARMYEETIHIAWHALSFWWFCQIDGRGPYPVRQNLEQHIETLRFIAETGKPFEPNIPHHFAFRGADDVSYVVSSVLAARTAKYLGVRTLILQNMLNTPKSTWGVQDLAKSRALLVLVRELEDERFRVVLQPRAGLDYFSPNLERAKVQLAAVTALMDDIEPHNPNSPPLIHVVSYSEASHLADPPVINESIQITLAALQEYRRLRAKDEVEDMARHPEVRARTEELLRDARTVLKAIEQSIPHPYSAEGLYRIFRAGFLPVPYLWEGREEFVHAVRRQTRLIQGSVKVVDERGIPIAVEQRVQEAMANAGACSDTE
ncbi:MAG: cobalamin-binding protein [Armatimonadota bacterium]|nr:cobalamin-binding protein [bacterium]MDW8320899.1 cobalamin-binding protein [Armatimonadota bacterium]